MGQEWFIWEYAAWGGNAVLVVEMHSIHDIRLQPTWKKKRSCLLHKQRASYGSKHAGLPPSPLPLTSGCASSGLVSTLGSLSLGGWAGATCSAHTPPTNTHYVWMNEMSQDAHTPPTNPPNSLCFMPCAMANAYISGRVTDAAASSSFCAVIITIQPHTDYRCSHLNVTESR
jgi:hypothetical protein